MRGRSKYGAVRTAIDGVVFDSKREAARYSELKLLQQAGEIRDLELQPAFDLRVPVRGSSGFEKIGIYKADFRYRVGPKGILVVEDVKGVKTPVYKLKKKIVEASYGIEITETT